MMTSPQEIRKQRLTDWTEGISIAPPLLLVPGSIGSGGTLGMLEGGGKDGWKGSSLLDMREVRLDAKDTRGSEAKGARGSGQPTVN